MPNYEHLGRLKEGVAAWNKWRAQNPDIVPDLSSAELRGMNLIGANLGAANLFRAQLDDANLETANLSGSNLSEARLFEANLASSDLSEAIIDGTTLFGANLQAADLTGATLFGADFVEANLDMCNMSRAALGTTSFGGSDLSHVKGLESVKHVSPSIIGIDTIYLSAGSISETFLRGVGIPDHFITFIKSLTTSPIDFYSCFISYSTKDQDFSDRLHADL